MSTGVKAHVAGSCGCKAGWFERWLSRPLIGHLCIVPEHFGGYNIYDAKAGGRIGLKVSFLRGSPSAFDAWWHANNPLLGATTCPLV